MHKNYIYIREPEMHSLPLKTDSLVKEGERASERETDRQTDRQTDRDKDRETETETESSLTSLA